MATDSLSLLRSGQLAGVRRLDLRAELTEFPREIFDLADSLEILNLSQNRLSELPADFARLSRLRILFCSENNFRHLPEVLGECPRLSMIGFKTNQIEGMHAGSLPKELRWLILTDNRLKALPASIGECHRLQKLMLSGNQLEHLPETMSACVNLELIRLAANRFRTLPPWLLDLPRLAWLAIAGNPLAALPLDTGAVEAFDWSALDLQAKIGEGASGIIHRATWQGDNEARTVAVKVFKGAMTSDGLPASELAVSLAAGRHPNLMEVHGSLAGHPQGGTGLVMPLIDSSFVTLAGPPSFDSCTRDVYPEGLALPLPALCRLALGVCSAAAHLHARSITHSDLYAHNVLWNAQGDCLLGDFGAASFYPPALAPALERVEVRAFGILLEELLLRCTPDHGQEPVLRALWHLRERCISGRPLFAQLQAELQELIAAPPPQPPAGPRP